MDIKYRNETIKQICQKTKSLNGLTDDPKKLIKALSILLMLTIVLYVVAVFLGFRFRFILFYLFIAKL